jgi:hypothetical protein
LEWELIRVLGGKFVKQVFCEICGEWVTYKRAAAREIIAARDKTNHQPLF